MALQPLHQFGSSSSPAASERQAKEVLSAKHAQEWTCGTYGAGFAPWSSAYARQRGADQKVIGDEDGIHRPKALMVEAGLLLSMLNAKQHDALGRTDLCERSSRLIVEFVAAHVALRQRGVDAQSICKRLGVFRTKLIRADTASTKRISLSQQGHWWLPCTFEFSANLLQLGEHRRQLNHHPQRRLPIAAKLSV